VFVTGCAQKCFVFNTSGASHNHKSYLFANLTTLFNYVGYRTSNGRMTVGGWIVKVQ